MDSYDRIRSLYVEWSMRDNYTTQATKINALVDRQKTSAAEATYSYLTMTGAMQQSFTNAGAFFALNDQQLRESSIRQTTQNDLLADTAVRYDRMKTAVRSYADTARTQIARASQYINEHQMAVVTAGAALTGAGYMGYRYYADGTKDLATYLDAYVTFRKSMGTESDAFIADMRDASGRMLTDTEIVVNTNKARLLGITSDALPTMASMARAAARQLGGDMSYYWESITTGTARESKLWLDNLGIIVDIDDARQRYAETLGITSDALTSEQEKIAFINAVLARQDDLIGRVDLSQDSLNETLKRSATSWKNLQSELTDGALPVIFTAARAAETLASALEGMPGPIKTVIGTGGLLATAVAGISGTLLINAAAVTYLSTNYGELVFVYGTLKSQAASYAASLLTRVIPAEVAQAYATGGLTAALYAGAAAGWAFVSPWLPWIALAGAAVGAGYLIWDLVTQGWENSALGKMVGWLNQNVPWLTHAFEYLAGVLGTVWGWITAIPGAVLSAWQGLTDHPLFGLAETVFRFTPVGLGLTAADLGATAAREMLASSAVTTANTSTTVINTEYKVNVGDIRTEKLDEEQVDTLFTAYAKKASKQTERDLTRQIKGITI